MIGSIVIFCLIVLLGMVLPVFNHSRDWGFKPAIVVGVVLVAAVVAKSLAWI